MRLVRLFILHLTLIVVVIACKKKTSTIDVIPDVKKNHLQRNHIFGNVKNLESQTFYIHKDSISVSDTSNLKNILECYSPDTYSYQHYTSDGFLMSYAKLDKEKDTILIRKYRYAPDALIESWEEFDKFGNCLTYGTYHYDRNRFIESEKIYKNDSIVISFKYSTDGIGNIVSAIQSFGYLKTKTENKYNEFGLVTKIVEYEPNGKVFKTAKIEYDNYGDEVNRCVYKSGNQMIEYTYNKYDQQGRQIQTIFEDRLHNIKEFHYFYKHDKNNNWKYEVCCLDGLIVYVKLRNLEYYEY